MVRNTVNGLAPFPLPTLANVRQRAVELRVSAREALDTHSWPTLWALAEGYDDLADFLEKPSVKRPLLRVVPEV